MKSILDPTIPIPVPAVILAASIRPPLGSSKQLACLIVVAIASLLLCANARSGAESSGSFNPAIQQASETASRLATGLRAYSVAHPGYRASQLSDLVPEYIASPDLIIAAGVDPTRPELPATFFLCNPPLPDPQNEGLEMIAFLTVRSGDSRIVIANDYRVLVVGELKFQEWLLGLGEQEGSAVVKVDMSLKLPPSEAKPIPRE